MKNDRIAEKPYPTLRRMLLDRRFLRFPSPRVGPSLETPSRTCALDCSGQVTRTYQSAAGWMHGVITKSWRQSRWSLARNADNDTPWRHHYVMTSDVNFLPWNISWNISRNISKISRCFFWLSHLTFLYVKHYLSFIYAYCSSLSLSAGLLAWFACLSIGSTVVIKLWLSSDYYDVRRTRYSPVVVTEVKKGSVSSTGT